MGGRVVATISEQQAGTLVLAVMILLVAALIGAKIAAFLGLPKVAGEILAGLVVGPTVLGRLFPGVYDRVFLDFAGEGQAISVFYWLGLIFLMFTSGCEADMKDVRKDGKLVCWLIFGATAPSLIVGYIISDRYFAEHYLGSAESVPVFNVTFALAVAVTSIPVISKIFLDLGLLQHRFARIILAAATIQDLFLWAVFSAAGSFLANRGFGATHLFLHVAATFAMFAFAMLAAPILGRIGAFEKLTIFSYDSVYFILCFLCIQLGSLFGVNMMYTAFVAGLIFKNIATPAARQAQAKVRDMCLAFFTPVYFATVGVRIHVTGDFRMGLFLAFLLVASAIELAGCVAAMRAMRMSWLTSLNFGIAMNARGGPGIVLAMVSYDMGIVSYEFFCVLVFTTLISSAAAGWWIDYINGKGKLLPP
ncbi:MAG: cation:proton antiporter [Planctomycetota bacterium]|jgi:Kef-type K+ transport system membrane component KefB|nr:cation:proton antiporter [Planctomycetota bacterium]